jgi:hypothetical protein
MIRIIGSRGSSSQEWKQPRQEGRRNNHVRGVAMWASRWGAWGAGVLAVAMGFPGARAQDAVPGGWAPEVGFQTFSAPGFAGGFGYFSAGAPFQGMGAPWSGFNSFPAARTFPMAPQFQTSPRVVNGLVPLADTIRKTTRKRGRR